jgi:hypothetical protein
MKSVSTQTCTTINTSTQVNNINLVINENTYHTQYSSSFDCKYNKIMKNYHKLVNEYGHSIIDYNNYNKIHSYIAKKTIDELTKAQLEIPFWLLSRANKNNNTK